MGYRPQMADIYWNHGPKRLRAAERRKIKGTMRSREVLKLIKAAGWYEVGRNGSHIQLKHDSRPGRTTVPHPKDQIPTGTLKNIERQSGVALRKP